MKHYEVKYMANGKTYSQTIKAISSEVAKSKAIDMGLNEPEVLGVIHKEECLTNGNVINYDQIMYN